MSDFYHPRICLHYVISRRTRHAVFIWTVVHDRRVSPEIVMRRWGRCGPFQCCRLPGIVTRFLPGFHAPEEIEQEYELARDGDKGRKSDEFLERKQAVHVRDLG